MKLTRPIKDLFGATVLIACCAIVVVSTLGAKGGNTSKFDASMSNFQFDYDSPSSGTFTCDISGSGSVSSVGSGSGEFTSETIDANTVHVFSFGESDTPDKYFSARANMQVDLSKSNMKSFYAQVVVIDKTTGEVFYSRKAVVNGVIEGMDVNGTTMTLDGTF